MIGRPPLTLYIMRGSRWKSDVAAISDEMGADKNEVSRVIKSYFSDMASRVRALPFDDCTKIYTRGAFLKYEMVWNIPHIGRIGTSHSRYLKWRANESKFIVQDRRSAYTTKLTTDDIESMADAIINGEGLPDMKHRTGNDLYKRVWIVTPDGRKQARQVIPKNGKKKCSK